MGTWYINMQASWFLRRAFMLYSLLADAASSINFHYICCQCAALVTRRRQQAADSSQPAAHSGRFAARSRTQSPFRRLADPALAKAGWIHHLKQWKIIVIKALTKHEHITMNKLPTLLNIAGLNKHYKMTTIHTYI